MAFILFVMSSALRSCLALALAIVVSSHMCESAAQEFTLASEYAKQSRKYPFIKPYLPDVGGAEVSLGVVYSHAQSGSELKLDVFRPRFAEDLLAPVVIIHGGGWQSGARSLDAPMAARLAEGGLCAFCVDYRLSGEATYPAAVVDINATLCWIASRADSLGVDMKRLTVMGTSAGGQLAALVGASNGSFPKFVGDGPQPPKIEMVVDVDGVLAFIHPDSSEGADKPGKLSSATRWLGTPMAADSTLWIEASAISHIGEWSAERFLFINSGQKRFSAGQDEAVESLRRLEKSVFVRKFEGTPHTFWLFEPWADEVATLIISEMQKM